jgi:hypothetical protein
MIAANPSLQVGRTGTTCGSRRATWVGRREVARRAGVDGWGRPTPAGSDEQVVSAGTILAEPKGGVFSKWQSAFEFARQHGVASSPIAP